MVDLAEILARYQAQPDMLLAALRDVQAASSTHSIGELEMIQIAKTLGVPLAKVYGVATFYSMYAVKPRGRHLIRICESAPCHLRGAVNVSSILQELLDTPMGTTTADGRFTLEYTSCLGVCGVAPAIMVDSDVHGNLSRERIVELLQRYE